jgi:alpha-1,2-mannosyltransferase
VLNGQVSWLLMVPLTLAWIAARRNRWGAAGALLGVTMTIKLFLLVFVPYLVMTRRWRALMAAAGTAAATLLIGLAVFGLDAYQSWTRMLGTVGWNFLALNGSVLGLLTRSFSPNQTYASFASGASLVRPVWLVAAAVIGTITFIATRRTDSPEQVDRGFATVLIAALLMSPLGWLYYVCLGLGPLVARAIPWYQSGRWSSRRLFWARRISGVCSSCGSSS